MLKILKENEELIVKDDKKSDLQAVEKMPVETIPALRFYQIAGRLNTILMAYEETDLNYSKTNELKSNIESILECEIVNNFIYKKQLYTPKIGKGEFTLIKQVRLIFYNLHFKQFIV